MNTTLINLVDTALAMRTFGVGSLKGYKSKSETCVCDCDDGDDSGGCSD